MIFGKVRVSLNWVEGLHRSVIVLVGPERKLIVDLAGMRKSTKCDVIFRAQRYSCVFSWKLIISIVKDFFKLFGGLRTSVIVVVGSGREQIDCWSSWCEQKYLDRYLSRLSHNLHLKLINLLYEICLPFVHILRLI